MADVNGKVTVSLKAEDPGRPGWKTTEFWLTLLVSILTALAASGVLHEDSPALQLVGLALLVLTQLGYTSGRARIKAEGLKALQPYLNDHPQGPAEGPGDTT